MPDLMDQEQDIQNKLDKARMESIASYDCPECGGTSEKRAMGCRWCPKCQKYFRPLQ